MALAADSETDIYLYDDDLVELSNLHRQVQFSEQDLGTAKVEALAAELQRQGCSPDRLHPSRERVGPSNIDTLLTGSSLVVEGSDSFATKFLVNQWCVTNETRLALGGCQRYEGQVFSIIPGGPCYECLFESPPADDDAQSCATAGVLGPVAGLIAGKLSEVALQLLNSTEISDFGYIWSDLRKNCVPRPLNLQVRESCRLH